MNRDMTRGWAKTLMCTLLMLLTLCAGSTPGGDGTKPNSHGLPTTGVHEQFSGAIGDYTISATAEPTTLYEEDSLLLTVRITGFWRDSSYLPNRDKLKLFPPEVAAYFHPPVPVPEMDRTRLNWLHGTWEFVYRLTPRRAEDTPERTGVKRIPPLLFVFFNPSIPHDPKSPVDRRFQPRESDEIPLTVKPRPEAVLPILAPERLFQVAEGETVLRHDRPAFFTHPLVLAWLVLLPVVVCVGWYSVWRRFYPDLDRLNRLRRSRAAKQALAALGRLREKPASGADGKPPAEQLVTIVREYLRQRVDLPGQEPTPAEVGRYLARLRLPRPFVQQATDLFHACDAARFASQDRPELQRLSAAAVTLINTLEAERCGLTL